MTIDPNLRGRILRQIAELECGWATVAEITCTIEPHDLDARRLVRQAIGELTRSGEMRSMHVRHRGQPLLCCFIDKHELLELAA